MRSRSPQPADVVLPTTPAPKARLLPLASNAAVLQRLPGAAAAQKAGAFVTAYTDAAGHSHALALFPSPFRVELFAEGSAGAAPVTTPSIVVNGRGLSYIEHR